MLAKCDALDGSADGMVQDVAACQTAFSLANDVATCTGARDGTCLSAAQRTVIGKIFSGPTTSTGALIYSSFPYKVPPESPAGFTGPNFSLTTSIDNLVAGINATNATYTGQLHLSVICHCLADNHQLWMRRSALTWSATASMSSPSCELAR